MPELFWFFISLATDTAMGYYSNQDYGANAIVVSGPMGGGGGGGITNPPPKPAACSYVPPYGETPCARPRTN